jgi:hypothetical protein
MLHDLVAPGTDNGRPSGAATYNVFGLPEFVRRIAAGGFDTESGETLTQARDRALRSAAILTLCPADRGKRRHRHGCRQAGKTRQGTRLH